jgi:hypothetical protein
LPAARPRAWFLLFEARMKIDTRRITLTLVLFSAVACRGGGEDVSVAESQLIGVKTALYDEQPVGYAKTFELAGERIDQHVEFARLETNGKATPLTAAEVKAIEDDGNLVVLRSNEGILVFNSERADEKMRTDALIVPRAIYERFEQKLTAGSKFSVSIRQGGGITTVLGALATATPLGG